MCGKRKWRYKSVSFEKSFLQKVLKHFISPVVSDSSSRGYWRECHCCGYRDYPPTA